VFWPQVAISVVESSQIGDARRKIGALALKAGLGEVKRGKLAIIATELCTNLVRYGKQGFVLIRQVGSEGRGVEIIAADRGPGMDLDKCLRDGFSSGGTSGSGLGSVQRQSDEFDIWSCSKGTVVLSAVHADDAETAYASVGSVCLAMLGEEACGDGWSVRRTDNGFQLLLIDGLGHGPLAQDAAVAAIACFDESKEKSALLAMDKLHIALQSTRGGAVALADIDFTTLRLAYCAVGNISGWLLKNDKLRGLVTLNGIVGGLFQKAKEIDYEISMPCMLVMHSDGLQSRWNLEGYPGLQNRHPSVMATILYRDFARGRDDACVLVAALRNPAGLYRQSES
jgi:anti-sigma regulatory factor (Ser/Thr protein kinase)